jgi:hypothetical protein
MRYATGVLRMLDLDAVSKALAVIGLIAVRPDRSTLKW